VQAEPSIGRHQAPAVRGRIVLDARPRTPFQRRHGVLGQVGDVSGALRGAGQPSTSRVIRLVQKHPRQRVPSVRVVQGGAEQGRGPAPPVAVVLVSVCDGRTRRG